MYRVIELQTTGNTTAMIDHNDFADRDHAESEAHDVAKYAAISSVEIHTVAIVNPEGAVVTKYCYKHEQNTQEVGEE